MNSDPTAFSEPDTQGSDTPEGVEPSAGEVRGFAPSDVCHIADCQQRAVELVDVPLEDGPQLVVKLCGAHYMDFPEVDVWHEVVDA